MQWSDERILTTHTGSLPRPPELTRLYVRRARGEAIDPAELDRVGKAALRRDWLLPAAPITASSGDRSTTKPASLLKSRVKRRQFLVTGAAQSTSWETMCPPPI